MYAAPEQLQGKCDPKVFSCLKYELYKYLKI